jgi:mannosyltransferase OCH1-like enzyme
MLNSLDFFKECEIETSLFDIGFAKTDIEWNILKKYFNNNINITGNYQIPKIIHFIWLGSDIPKWYQQNIEDWKNKTGFDIQIWDDKKSNSFMQDKHTSKEYFSCENYGMKSDILRYEILYVYGGLYVDTDFLCINSKIFQHLHENYNFYSGICLERCVQFNNGLVASCAGHDIIYNTILSIPNRLNDYEDISCKYTKILFQTGPWALSDAITTYLFLDCQKSDKDQGIIPLPSKMFHPFPAAKRHDNVSPSDIKLYFSEYTAACHLWHTSWQGQTQGFTGNINEF